MYNDKKRISKMMLVIACFLVACEQQAPAPVTSDGKGPNAAHPTTLTNMNGWHGIEVARSQLNGRMSCSISFPPNFGMSKEEMDLLVYMVAQRRAVRERTDCWISPNDVYQALNQLLRLVVDKQNPAAASLLLYQGTMEIPFNLDGEVAEGYTESYLVPVLEKYEKLDTALDPPRQSVIAKDICANLQWRDDIKDPVFKKRIQLLAKRLKAKGMGRFAREIESCDLSRPPGQ